jgi:hypothetical protein
LEKQIGEHHVLGDSEFSMVFSISFQLSKANIIIIGAIRKLNTFFEQCNSIERRELKRRNALARTQLNAQIDRMNAELLRKALNPKVGRGIYYKRSNLNAKEEEFFSFCQPCGVSDVDIESRYSDIELPPWIFNEEIPMVAKFPSSSRRAFSSTSASASAAAPLLRLRQCPHLASPMQIFVKKSVPVQTIDTVLVNQFDYVAKILALYDPDSFLVYESKSLDPSKQLHSYGISAQSTLTLMSRIYGGNKRVSSEISSDAISVAPKRIIAPTETALLTEVETLDELIRSPCKCSFSCLLAHCSDGEKIDYEIMRNVIRYCQFEVHQGIFLVL